MRLILNGAPSSRIHHLSRSWMNWSKGSISLISLTVRVTSRVRISAASWILNWMSVVSAGILERWEVALWDAARTCWIFENDFNYFLFRLSVLYFPLWACKKDVLCDCLGSKLTGKIGNWFMLIWLTLIETGNVRHTNRIINSVYSIKSVAIHLTDARRRNSISWLMLTSFQRYLRSTQLW